MSPPPQGKTWYQKQQDALDNKEGEILIKWGNYHFTTFLSQDEVVDFIEETPEENRHFYEVLTDSKPQRMFADLDGEGLTINKTQLLKSWTKLMKQVFNDVGLFYDDKKVKILKSRGDKISFHWSYLESFKLILLNF